jgi:hypothetical protein
MQVHEIWKCSHPRVLYSPRALPSGIWYSSVSRERHSCFRFSFIFRYFKVLQVSQMFTYGLSDLLLLAVGSLVVFLLQEYTLKVHILVSSEHKLCQIWNTCIVHCTCIYWLIAFLNKLLIYFFLAKITIKSHIY